MSVSELRIDELMGDNEGAALDQAAETEDYVELFNAGTESVNLGCVSLSREGSSTNGPPRLELKPQQVAVLWADEQPDQTGASASLSRTRAGQRLPRTLGEK